MSLLYVWLFVLFIHLFAYSCLFVHFAFLVVLMFSLTIHKLCLIRVCVCHVCVVCVECSIDVLRPRVWHSINHVNTIRCHLLRENNVCDLCRKIFLKCYCNVIVLKIENWYYQKVSC